MVLLALASERHGLVFRQSPPIERVSEHQLQRAKITLWNRCPERTPNSQQTTTAVD
jgi:hypothetical protein